mgnify:CR=1 FL=1
MRKNQNPQSMDSLLESIQRILHDVPWQSILNGFAITGVLDNEQLKDLSGLERGKLSRTLDKLESLRGDLPSIIHPLKQDYRRPGARGRTPSVFALGESGAGLLQRLGQENARACELHDEIAVTHALAMNDLHLTAERAGVSVQTDRTIAYNADQVLRPDHQISLPGRKTAIFEIEQKAGPETLRRVQASIERKRAFFESRESAAYERTVHVLFQLPRGKVWNKTISTWQQAVNINENQHGKSLNFSLRTMSLPDFLSAPDWHGRSQRWMALGNPEPQSTGIEKNTAQVPQHLIQRSPREERLILAALWQDFLENTSKRLDDYPLPDPEFLATMRLIYVASHDQSLPPLVQAGVPHASIYLLGQYLRLRGIRKQLYRAMNSGRGNLRMNLSMVMHRIQTVVNAFLKLNGWRSYGPLQVNVATSFWEDSGPRTYKIEVRIRDPQILIPADETLMPSRNEVEFTEQALAWVLQALFEYSQELNLGSPEFW